MLRAKGAEAQAPPPPSLFRPASPRRPILFPGLTQLHQFAVELLSNGGGFDAPAQPVNGTVHKHPLIIGERGIIAARGCDDGTRVRIHGIATPSMETAQGPASRNALQALIEGRTVACEQKGTSYNRIVATCLLEGQNIAADLPPLTGPVSMLVHGRLCHQAGRLA